MVIRPRLPSPKLRVGGNLADRFVQFLDYLRKLSMPSPHLHQALEPFDSPLLLAPPQCSFGLPAGLLLTETFLLFAFEPCSLSSARCRLIPSAPPLRCDQAFVCGI